jgi:hypothetical protein
MTPVPFHKAAAIGLFRTSVFFVFAIAAFAESDKHTQTLLLTVVFLLDVISWHKVNCDVNACISYCQKRNPQGGAGQTCNSGCMITMEERKKKGQCK